MLCVIDFSLIFFDTSWGIYSIPKELKYTAVFLSKNNEIQCVSLVCLLSIFMTYVPSFIIGKLSLEKYFIKPKFLTEILSNLDIDYRME